MEEGEFAFGPSLQLEEALFCAQAIHRLARFFALLPLEEEGVAFIFLSGLAKSYGRLRQSTFWWRRRLNVLLFCWDVVGLGNDFVRTGRRWGHFLFDGWGRNRLEFLFWLLILFVFRFGRRRWWWRLMSYDCFWLLYDLRRGSSISLKRRRWRRITFRRRGLYCRFLFFLDRLDRSVLGLMG